MRFVKESVIRASPERVFGFHEQPDVLSLLIPPWENARVVRPARISELGTQAIVEVRVFGPVTVRWIAEHTVYDPPHMFEDVQIKSCPCLRDSTGESEAWQKGFRVGIESMIDRLRQAVSEGGLPEIEATLKRPYDASGYKIEVVIPESP